MTYDDQQLLKAAVLVSEELGNADRSPGLITEKALMITSYLGTAL